MTGSTENDTEQSSHSERRARRFEQVVVATSVILTVALLGYATWQMFTIPTAATPQVSVEDTQTQPDGSVRVTIALSNPQDRGLEQVTVKTTCQNKSVLVQFSYVSAGSTQTAYVMCPPGTDNPEVSLSSWIG